ncbi:hypothetical protein LDENG_00143180 [Lucifuga dentata]|nr:hypothetical protein LDENG_00143180 [Lucifuga dentata]
MDSMFAYETQILQQLVVLVVCHGLTVGEIMSQYSLSQRPMSWHEAQQFCQRHYVDLAVLSTEEQYFALLNTTAAQKVSYWLGLQRQSIHAGWKWVDGEALTYEHWYRKNYVGHCASLETMMKKDKKLLNRYCNEPHAFICQGPVSPQPVQVDSVGTDHVILSWNVSVFMQMISHSYIVTTCTHTCDMLLYPYIKASTFVSITIPNLTLSTEYSISVASFVVRPDSATGESVICQSDPAALQVKTADSGEQYKVIILLKLIKLGCLAPPLWILYHILKRAISKESHPEVSSSELFTDDSIGDLIPDKTQEIC